MASADAVPAHHSGEAPRTIGLKLRVLTRGERDCEP